MNRAQVLILAITIFVCGASTGSFFNVCLYRIPKKLSVVNPPSACPCCSRQIRWRDNIPILSWIMLKGKCRDCGCKISPRYILIETAAGLSALGIFLILRLCLLSK